MTAARYFVKCGAADAGSVSCPPAIESSPSVPFLSTARDVCECGRSKQVKSSTCGGCRSVSAEADGNWKGGRTRHKAGYVMVHVPGHPRATSGPYIFEHILVAEDLLGRYLRDGETVHHRNGVRDDNRPENLELWTSPQPSGIRVSDAIACGARDPRTV